VHALSRTLGSTSAFGLEKISPVFVIGIGSLRVVDGSTLTVSPGDLSAWTISVCCYLNA
jgi:hypothetical protein